MQLHRRSVRSLPGDGSQPAQRQPERFLPERIGHRCRHQPQPQHHRHLCRRQRNPARQLLRQQQSGLPERSLRFHAQSAPERWHQRALREVGHAAMSGRLHLQHHRPQRGTLRADPDTGFDTDLRRTASEPDRRTLLPESADHRPAVLLQCQLLADRHQSGVPRALHRAGESEQLSGRLPAECRHAHLRGPAFDDDADLSCGHQPVDAALCR